MTEAGRRHALPQATGERPWRVQAINPKVGGPREYDAVWAWRLADGAVVLQGEDGDVTIAPDCLVAVANALLATHVHNGRADVKGT